MVEIELTNHNLLVAGLIGISRQIKGIRKMGQYGADNMRYGWQYNCEGAAGEIAVAKYMNMFYDGAMGNFLAKDVGKYQVRTNHESWGDLILHKKDVDKDKYILVLCHRSPIYVLAGWLYGSEGKKEKWWRDGEKGRPAYFVPQDELRDIIELKEEMQGR